MDSLERSGVHCQVTRVPDLVQPSKDRVEVDSARLPESQIPRNCSSAWRSRDWRSLGSLSSASTGGNDTGFDASLLRAVRQRRPSPLSSFEHLLILRINV